MNEILAPCGSFESLFAALNAGTDAVYVGMKRFSARKNAENFSDEELKTATEECHKRGVKIYVALNTLVYDRELGEFAECIKTAAKCGVDGLIIQDLGAAALAKAICPDLPRHASTQMTLNSVCGVKAAEKLGFCRVVIGRELSECEIKHISDNTNAELEIFVHGALCVCVSGQCYMSSLFGGRSGNRGLCAQPCRLDFSCGDRHNVISLKDQSIIKHLRDPGLSQIASYKIEGRMKRPEYVACAVNACRCSLDNKPYDFERLSGIFSRGGLTESYFDGSMRDMNGIRGKEDVENSSTALKGIKELYKNEFQRIPLDISVEIKRDKNIVCKVKCGNENEHVLNSDILPEIAVGKPIDEKSVCERMCKLGGTPFYAQSVSADVDKGLYVSAAALNDLRRKLCDMCYGKSPVYTVRDYALPVKDVPKTQDHVQYRAEVSTKEQLEQALELDFSLIYAPIGLLDENTPDKNKIVVIPPLILTDCEEKCAKKLRILRNAGFKRGLAHTLGHAELLKECGFSVLGGYRMNVLNSLFAKECADFGFSDITLSFEGTAAELAEINSPIPKGIVAFGRLPLMLTRRCPIADGKPCGRKNALNGGKDCGGSLKDRLGNDIPVLCGGNCVEPLNPDTLVLSDKTELLRKFDFIVLKFTTENNVSENLKMYQNGNKPDGKITRGLYFRGAE